MFYYRKDKLASELFMNQGITSRCTVMMRVLKEYFLLILSAYTEPVRNGPYTARHYTTAPRIESFERYLFRTADIKR